MAPLLTRLGAEPMIHAGMNARMNNPDVVNINGPSIVRMPAWATGRLGRYHMYFAHHKGHYIRLAYADDLAGPWAVHDPGVLDLADSLFEPVNPTPDLDVPPPYWADDLGDYLYAHIASPDVHIDHDRRCIHMYYHGLLYDGNQQTRYAISHDGLAFTPHEPLLGGPYFRAMLWGGMIYAIDWDGTIYRSSEWAGPFEIVPWGVPDSLSLRSRDDDDVLHRLRHPHWIVRQGRVHLCFTRIGDAPEAIYLAEVFPSQDPDNPSGSASGDRGDSASGDGAWIFGPAQEILRPDPGWEGGDLPITPSIMGTAVERLHQLRDPFLFIDGQDVGQNGDGQNGDGKTGDGKTGDGQNGDGDLYLAYCGGGESGIGIARITGI